MPSGARINWQLLLPVIAINVANGVAFCDILGISAIIPDVSDHFETVGAIEWSTTAQLIGATVGQCLLGYFSDVWSRRNMLLFALSILLAATLTTSFVFRIGSSIVFVVLRALSGMAVGSISNLANIAQSDIATKEQRLKLQGVQGISVALGSITGMMVGARFAQQGKSHRLYFVESGLTAVAIVLIALFLKPQRKSTPTESFQDVIKHVDYVGILSGVGLIVPALILLSNGSKLPTTTIAVLGTLAGICLLVYVYSGMMNPLRSRPIVPFQLFRNRTLTAIYSQNVLFGAAYYTFIYFLPIYLMVVRQIEPLPASAMMIPYFVCHGAWSAGSARVVLRLQRNNHRGFTAILLIGFLIWSTSTAFLAGSAACKRVAPPIEVVIILATFVGFGTGSVFQNSVLLIREQVGSEQSAVAIGTRNVLRYLGGAIGTAISGTIMSMTLKSKIPKGQGLERFRVHTVNSKELHHLTLDQRKLVQVGFTRGITWVFATSTVLLALCAILCALIREGSGKADEEGAMEDPTLTLSEAGMDRPIPATKRDAEVQVAAITPQIA